MAIRRGWGLVVAVGLLGMAFLGGVAAYRVSSSSSPPAPPATNAHLAHDPARDRRAPRAYRETLDGRRYVNRDLGLSVTGPEGWAVSLGARPEDAGAHEGLVVKMEPPGDPDGATLVRPLLSVVKRTLPEGGPRDPVAYIRERLLSPRKTVVEAPSYADVCGRRMGTVAYEMPSGRGSIRIVQHVHVGVREAIIVSAMAPSGMAAGLDAAFQGVIGSIRFDPEKKA